MGKRRFFRTVGSMDSMDGGPILAKCCRILLETEFTNNGNFQEALDVV